MTRNRKVTKQTKLRQLLTKKKLYDEGNVIVLSVVQLGMIIACDQKLSYNAMGWGRGAERERLPVPAHACLCVYVARYRELNPRLF